MKSQSYHNFWQRIHKSAKNNAFPLRVMFELTYRCNFHCKHCYVPQSYRNYNELKAKEVFSILDQLKDIGCFYLGFTGGEPFIRKDIMDILWYAKRKGFEVIIYTNGSLIDEKMAEELIHLKPNKVDITIPAMTEAAFEKITQASGSHKRVFKAIDLLHKRRVELGFKSCVLKENESEIEDIQEFAESLGALHRLDDILSPCLDGSREPFRHRGTLLNANRRKSDANFRESIDANRRKSDANLRECLNEGISVNSRAISENSRLFKCGVGVSQAAITPFGELKMCLMIDYPKYKILGVEDRKTRIYAKNQTQMHANKYSRELALDSREFALKDAWERLKELVTSIKSDKDYKCHECKLEPYCKWCPAKAWLYNRTFTSCEPESRRWAKIRIQNYSLKEKIHGYRERDRGA